MIHWISYTRMHNAIKCTTPTDVHKHLPSHLCSHTWTYAHMQVNTYKHIHVCMFCSDPVIWRCNHILGTEYLYLRCQVSVTQTPMRSNHPYPNVMQARPLSSAMNNSYIVLDGLLQLQEHHPRAVLILGQGIAHFERSENQIINKLNFKNLKPHKFINVWCDSPLGHKSWECWLWDIRGLEV